MNFVSEFSRAFVLAIGWTIIHSLWLGAICAAIAGIALGLMSAAASRLRYAVACASLILLVGLLGVTFVIEWKNVPEGSSLRHPSSVDLPKEPQVFAKNDFHPKRSIFEIAGTLEKGVPQLVLIWATGVFLFSIRNIRAWNAVRRLRGAAETISEIGIESRLLEFASRLAIARPIRLLKSAVLDIPVAIGWLRPVVILPLSTLSGLTPNELDAILIHELAHISRHDYLVNLLQVAAETVLFYHPAVWWISRRIREEREDCCDDIVIALQGDRATYANALATLEERRAFPPQFSAAANGGDLIRRIRRIASGRREGRIWPVGIVTGAIVLGCLVAFMGSHSHSLAAGNSNHVFELRQVIEPESSQAGEEFAEPRSGATLKLSREVLLDASKIVSAEIVQDDVTKTPEISVHFNETGANLLAEVTKNNIGKRIAMISDGKVLAAPTLRSAIAGGAMIITGNFTMAEARRISKTINESHAPHKNADPKPAKVETNQPGAVDSPIASEKPTEYLQVMKRLDMLQQNLSNLLSKYTENHPLVVENRRSIAELEDLKQKLEAGSSPMTPAISKAPTADIHAELNKQLGKWSDQVSALEENLRSFRRNEHMSERAIEEIGRENGNLIKGLEQEKVTATITLLNDELKLKQLQSKSRADLRNTILTVNPDGQLLSLFEAASKAEQQLASAKEEFAEQHPKVVALKTVRATIEKQIDERADGVLEALKAGVDQDQKRLNTLNEAIQRARRDEFEAEDHLQSYFAGKEELERAKSMRKTISEGLIQEQFGSRIPGSGVVLAR